MRLVIDAFVADLDMKQLGFKPGGHQTAYDTRESGDASVSEPRLH